VFRFGPSKFDAAANLPIIKDYDCSRKKVLAEQIRDADILALQEYFDSAQTYDVMNELIDEVERQTLEATGKNITWDFKCGKAGGHETAKEQACYLWRTDVAKLTQSATYEEKAGQNIFSRQPFYAEFAINKKGFSIPKIVLGTIHTEPSNADKEIAALASVTKDIAKLFKNPNAMVFGDYNGDCQYLRNSARLANGMFLDPDYDCLINNELDSASMTTDCTFDRAFVMGIFNPKNCLGHNPH
jgi:endonuclease/exonuclease/phosphatase family metal-dependent hydrolase